jgi:uncharacterized membrane protein
MGIVAVMLSFYPRAVSAPVTGNRFSAFDRLRGLIMVIMAIDHASFMVARVHAYEGWAFPPGPVTVTRWITHLCAPGFLMLMGAGMVWLGKARQQAGWTHAQIRKFFLTRGLILLVIQHLVENPAWVIGVLTMDPSTPLAQAPSPGGGTPFFLHFGVLSALAVAMIVWAFLIELPSVIILAVSAAAMAASVWMTPAMSESATLFPIWKVLLFVPSHTNAVDVLYPVVPWLVPAGIGIVLGRIVYKKPAKTALLCASLAVALVGAYVALGLVGQGAFLKYPPTPAFFAITLGLDFLLIALFTAMPANPLTRLLETFGRSPRFFYLLHLYVFALIGLGFPRGTSMPVMYAIWAAGLALMYPMVVTYARFKASKPVTSVWRML